MTRHLPAAAFTAVVVTSMLIGLAAWAQVYFPAADRAATNEVRHEQR